MAGTLVTLILSSSILAAALPAQVSFSTGYADPCDPGANARPAEEVYCGTGIIKCDKFPTKLRISNGGAGLSGLVGYLANLYIDKQVKQKVDRFKIEWIKGDTTETLEYLEAGLADVGITYNKAAECQAIHAKVSDRREYGFRDHFYLVGPKSKDKDSNPAGLEPLKGDKPEDILAQMQKIVRTGNHPVKDKLPTRFLSRYDKSATNIKDSELFVSIGQVPWGLAYSKWYHQYTMYPKDALQAAALLQEYTITDRGTWLSTNKTYTKELTIYNEGKDKNPKDPLLNPAFFLNSKKSCRQNYAVAGSFLDWVITDGQEAVKAFRKSDDDSWLYTEAPTEPAYQPIKDCSVTGV